MLARAHQLSVTGERGKPPAACSLLSSNSGLIEPLSALSVSVFVFKLKERQRETFIEISADRESIGIL